MIKILILGGGFGGVRCALDLEKKIKDRIQITLIDRNNYHLFLEVSPKTDNFFNLDQLTSLQPILLRRFFRLRHEGT